MSWFVVQVNNEGSKRAPQVGQMWERETWDKAVDLVVDLALEQTDHDRKSIREEVEADGDFAHPDGDFTIAICQIEN